MVSNRVYPIFNSNCSQLEFDKQSTMYALLRSLGGNPIRHAVGHLNRNDYDYIARTDSVEVYMYIIILYAQPSFSYY